jgi:hypothetical protein
MRLLGIHTRRPWEAAVFFTGKSLKLQRYRIMPARKGLIQHSAVFMEIAPGILKN